MGSFDVRFRHAVLWKCSLICVASTSVNPRVGDIGFWRGSVNKKTNPCSSNSLQIIVKTRFIHRDLIQLVLPESFQRKKYRKKLTKIAYCRHVDADIVHPCCLLRLTFPLPSVCTVNGFCIKSERKMTSAQHYWNEVKKVLLL